MRLSPSKSTIFFVHRGPLQPYVRASILQARKADPESSIVLLGDQEKHEICPEIGSLITHERLENLSAQADTFAEKFRFEGNNSFEYELLNFQRWFYVQSFCEEHSLAGPILVLDSDAYLYLAVGDVVPNLSTPMTVVDRVGPQFTFFRSVEHLAKFTTFLYESFSTDTGFERLRDFVSRFQSSGVPHISDMAAFGVFSEQHALEDIGAPDREDFVFCENIGSAQGMVMNLMGKKVTVRRGRRYFTTVERKKVLAGGVHLQGGNKALWPYFVDDTVREKFRRSSPKDYWRARRTGRQKALTIRLLRASARSKNLLALRSPTSISKATHDSS